MALICVKNGDVISLKIFLAFLDIAHKNKIHHWNPEQILHQIQVFFTQKFQFQNLTFFDPLLTHNDLTLRSDVKMNVTIVFYA